MKKIFLIVLSVLIIAGLSGVLWSQYTQKQKVEARASIDSAFSLMDVTKDYFDQLKNCLDAKERLDADSPFQQAIGLLTQSETAFKDGEYSKAINLAHESGKLIAEFRTQFDNVVLPRKTANLCKLN